LFREFIAPAVIDAGIVRRAHDGEYGGMLGVSGISWRAEQRAAAGVTGSVRLLTARLGPAQSLALEPSLAAGASAGELSAPLRCGRLVGRLFRRLDAARRRRISSCRRVA
jgi:hypothetical protein